MATTLESLKRHSDTLASIRSIVHTMKTLSAINATPYEHAATSINIYHETILQGFATFAHRTGTVPAFHEDTNEQLMVVFGSDHGLCGNYNEVLADVVKTEFQPQAGLSRRLLCVGARMNDALLDRGLSVEMVLLPPASADGIGRLASDIVTRIDTISHGRSRGDSAITLAFTQRSERGLRKPLTQRLLPLAPALFGRERTWDSRSLPDYRMSSEALLSALVRSHIFASVFRASAEAMVTENSARLELMQQAEQSVDDRLDAVHGDLRSARQTEITSELLDVIVGFEALKQRTAK